MHRKNIPAFVIIIIAVLLVLITTSTAQQQNFNNGTTGSGTTFGNGSILDVTQPPYNVKADAKTGSDGTSTNTSPTFSSTNQSCVATDVGKLLIAVNTSNGAYIYGTGLVTVLGCNGASWTASANANASVAGTLNWAIGTNAGSALATAYAAALAARQILALPCGTLIVTAPPFIGPASGDWLTQHPDISGCAATGGTGFILHPQITNGFGASGNIFASFSFTSATGTIAASGLGGQSGIRNIFITSIGGALPVTNAGSYSLINGYNTLDGITVTLLGFNNSATVNLAGTSSGEAHYSRLNFQNITVNGAATPIANGVSFGGQGMNNVIDSLFAFQGIANAILCASSTCSINNTYVTQTSQGVGCGSGTCFISLVNSTVTVSGGGGSLGALFDNNANTKMYVFGNSNVSTTQANFPAIGIQNASSVLDISGSVIFSNTAGCNVFGAGQVNDRAGNSWSSPLNGTGNCVFSGQYVPIGGGSVATNNHSANTNLGTVLTTQNIVATSIGTSTYDIKVGFRQVTAGTTCGAGSNTVTGTLNWTAGGAAQSVAVGGTLTVSANGTVGTSSSYTSTAIHADVNTAITFTTASTLASAGCTVVPQYVVDYSNI